MWEIWCWNGRYIKGDLVKRYKTKSSALKYVTNNIEHKEIVPGPVRDLFYVEGEHHTVALIEKKKSKK